jgi:hypothetical protein
VLHEDQRDSDAQRARSELSSGTPSTTSSVTRWKPRGRGLSVIWFWIHMARAES